MQLPIFATTFLAILLSCSAVLGATAHHKRQCAICPKCIVEKEHEHYELIFDDDEKMTDVTLCGYEEKEEPANQGFCSYYNTGERVPQDPGADAELKHCPAEVETEECK
ncbi:hypothetical protein C8F01DRAFT_1152800 [Mycena amicta]|nr:hypothetical protein C8F01DRAFT_1152800 [Mycena amicta]